MEATVRNHIRQLQNIKSHIYHKLFDKLFEEEQFELQNSDFSSKVLLTKVTTKVCSNETTRTQSLKRYTENTSLSNIYQRFYRPGSYALRGVIDHNICLQMGAPLFLLAFSDASLDPILIVVPEESLITFNCYIALLKASRLIKRMKTFQFYYCHKTFIH